MRFRILLGLAILTLPQLLAAQVYRWTDSNGTVHFADAPPPNGVPYETIEMAADAYAGNPPPPPTASESEVAEAPQEPTTVADTPGNRAKVCEQLEKNIALLEGAGPVSLKGTDTNMTEEQRARELANAREQFDNYCN